MDSPSSRLGGINRDFCEALRQQMFFWGQDVIHPTGNLLVKAGFERRPSEGLKGTSCYRQSWQGGLIELHGSCCGWYHAGGGGFVYIRAKDRCFAVESETPVIPGHPENNRLRQLAPVENQARVRPLLEWLLVYERGIEQLVGPARRERCHQELAKRKTIRPWLAPKAARQWLALYLRDSGSIVRARNFIG